MRFCLLAIALYLAGCSGDNFNGGLRLKEAPQNYGTNAPRTRLIPAPNPAGQQFITVKESGGAASMAPQPNGVRWTWQHTNAGPEYVTFRFYGRTNITATATLLGTNSIPVWEQWFSNGPMMFLHCVAVDRDQVFASDGKPK